MIESSIALFLLGIMFGASGHTPLSLVAAALGFIVWGILRWLRSRKDKAISGEEAATLAEAGVEPEKEGKFGPVMRIVIALTVFWAAFLISRSALPGFLLDWPGQNTVLYQNIEEAETEQNYAEVLRLIRERMSQSISQAERDQLEEREVATLLAWGQQLMDDGRNAEAYDKWAQAWELAVEYGFVAQAEALGILLTPTPTPMPTQTPAPTFTPLPTFTPQATQTLQPTYTPQATQTPYPTPTVLPTLPTGFNDCVGAEFVEQKDLSASEILQLYRCTNEAGLYKVVWLIAQSATRPARQYSSLVREGDINGATFVPGNRGSFRVTVKDGRMVVTQN